MAFTNVQTWVHADTAFASPTSLSKALASAPSAGDLIILAFWINAGGAGLSSVTDDMTDGGSWQVALTDITGMSARAYIYYKVVGGSANTNKTITVTMTTNLDMELFAGVYRGTGTLATDGTNSANGNSTNPTPGAIVTTGNDGLVIGFGRTDGNDPTAAAGFTARSTGALSFYVKVEDQITTASGSYTASWTAASGLWVALAAAFKDTSAASIVGSNYYRQVAGMGG
jgi:hypothetical protein